MDISFPGVIPDSLGSAAEHASVPADRRPLLCSFKGVDSHPCRKPLYALHNGEDIVCIDATAERQPEALQKMLGRADFEYPDLTSASKFVLCPRGDDVYSFRFVEALSCGAVPVISGDGWVLPFSELLDYATFCVLMAEADAAHTATRLRTIGPPELRALQAEGRRVFDAHFATIERQLETLLQIEALRQSEDASQARRYQTPDMVARLVK